MQRVDGAGLPCAPHPQHTRKAGQEARARLFHGYEITFDPPVIPDALKAKHLHRKEEKALEVTEENRVWLQVKGQAGNSIHDKVSTVWGFTGGQASWMSLTQRHR